MSSVLVLPPPAAAVVVVGAQGEGRSSFLELRGDRRLECATPASGIRHAHVASMMEVSLLLYEAVLSFGLWPLLDLHDRADSAEYGRRRRKALGWALWVYTPNEQLWLGPRARLVASAVLAGMRACLGMECVPLVVCRLVAEYERIDWRHSHRRESDGMNQFGGMFWDFSAFCGPDAGWWSRRSSGALCDSTRPSFDSVMRSRMSTSS